MTALPTVPNDDTHLEKKKKLFHTRTDRQIINNIKYEYVEQQNKRQNSWLTFL